MPNLRRGFPAGDCVLWIELSLHGSDSRPVISVGRSGLSSLRRSISSFGISHRHAPASWIRVFVVRSDASAPQVGSERRYELTAENAGRKKTSAPRIDRYGFKEKNCRSEPVPKWTEKNGTSRCRQTDDRGPCVSAAGFPATGQIVRETTREIIGKAVCGFWPNRQPQLSAAQKNGGRRSGVEIRQRIEARFVGQAACTHLSAVAGGGAV